MFFIENGSANISFKVRGKANEKYFEEAKMHLKSQDLP